MEACLFHPRSIRRAALGPHDCLPVADRVVATGPRLDNEIETGRLVRNMPGWNDDYVTASLGAETGSIATLVSTPGDMISLSSALRGGGVSGRVALVRYGESFSYLTRSILRLQDHHLVHGSVEPSALFFHTPSSRPRLGLFSRSLRVTRLGESSRPVAYAPFPGPVGRHVAPEVRLLTALVHEQDPAEAVSLDCIEEVFGAGSDEAEAMSKVVGLPVQDAIACLESTWRTWDTYSLCHTYTQLLYELVGEADITRNHWLCGILCTLETGKAADPSVRPSLTHLRKTFEKAWYLKGDGAQCQEAVTLVERMRV